jgi:hypothetical protein
MRGPSKETLDLIQFGRLLLATRRPMTLRQLHYAIFSAACLNYPNTQKAYKRLSEVTTMARREYRRLQLAGELDQLDSEFLIDPRWIVDEIREAELVSLWDNAEAFMDTVKSAYRRNYWQTQPIHVELWSEKATILGSMRPITQEYGIMLRVCRGFASTGFETKIAEAFEDISKPIVVFYIGDFDPSGICIERDIHQRVQIAAGKHFRMIRLAIHAEDITRYNLPPQPIKATDTRAAAFKARFGNKAATVELDALPVEVLRARVKEAIKSKIDWELWNRQVIVETAEIECIRDFTDRVKNLPQIPE